MPELVPVTAGGDLIPPTGSADLVRHFFEGKNAHTQRAYAQDLADFAAFLGAGTAAEAVQTLFGRPHGEANALVLGYRAALLAKKLAPASINRRLSAVRALVALGRVLGRTTWRVEVRGVKSEPYRDTKGTGLVGFRRLLGVLQGRSDPKALRDRALLRCMFDLALRAKEVIGLDYPEDLDLEGGRLFILGKARSNKEPVTLPPETATALREWLAARGDGTGPLFRNLDRAGKGGRLLTSSLWRIVQDLGKRAGIKARPHAIRHASITLALETLKDVRAAQRFSRHKDLNTLMIYDDSVEDLAGKVAKIVAAAV